MKVDLEEISSSEPMDCSDEELLDEITAVLGRLLKPKEFAFLTRRLYLLYARSIYLRGTVARLEEYIKILK